ncbi:rCG55042 [Rattus norvegicus]|uniref:RCG55042 n=1 Tax=Rattus norvegicus TaxID=10116 RepID=A6II69_RAT|nr:rCG55042 [Rattus norvegicus]
MRHKDYCTHQFSHGLGKGKESSECSRIQWPLPHK